MKQLFAQTTKQAATVILGTKFWIVVLSIAILCAFSGPFGTFEKLDLTSRLIYWVSIAVVTGMAGVWVSMLTIEFDFKLPLTLVASCVFGLFVTGFVALLQSVVDGRLVEFHMLGILFMFCFPTSIVILVVANHFMHPNAKHLSEEIDGRPKLFDRLENGADVEALFSLSACDHYVEVSTNLGDALVLARLADAISECSSIPGEQIHRSHWVALAAIEKLDVSRQKPQVTLKSGRAFPISRARIKSLKLAMERDGRTLGKKPKVS